MPGQRKYRWNRCSACNTPGALWGLEGDDLNSVLTELDDKAGDAINSGGDVADAFRRVGLEVEDLRGQKPDELLFLIADGLQNIENNQQRVNVVQAIFGDDDGRRLLPLLQQGGDAIRALGDEFASTGQIIDAQSAANAEVVERGMQRISAAVRGGGDRIGQFVTNLIAPAFRRIANESETQTDAAILALQDKVQEAHAAGLNFGTAMTDPVIIELRRLTEEAGVTVDTIIHEFRRAELVAATREEREALRVSGRRRATLGRETTAGVDDAASRALIEGFGNQANEFIAAQEYFLQQQVGLYGRFAGGSPDSTDIQSTYWFDDDPFRVRERAAARAAALQSTSGGGLTTGDPFAIGGGYPSRYASTDPVNPGAGAEVPVTLSADLIGASGGIRIDGESLLNASKSNPLSVVIAGFSDVAAERRTAAFSFDPAGQLQNQDFAAYLESLNLRGLT